MARLLETHLRAIKLLRVLPESAARYGLRQLALPPGAPIDAEAARKIGEHCEARRLLWGGFRRVRGQWEVTARVMTVANGQVGADCVVRASDWSEAAELLAGQILEQLEVKPSPEERQELRRRLAASNEAVEWYIKAVAQQADRRPLAEQEASLRQAIKADPDCAHAWAGLGAVLGSLGQLEEAESAVRKAVAARPNLTGPRDILAFVLLNRSDPAEASLAIQSSLRLDPDNPEALLFLGQLATLEEQWAAAASHFQKAMRLDRTDASCHALLGVAYARLGKRQEAIIEFREAERLDPDDSNSEQMIARGYQFLHETAMALEHFKKLKALLVRKGSHPQWIENVEASILELQVRLQPTFLEVSMPRRFTPKELNDSLRNSLTRSERRLVLDPLASQGKMSKWAQSLTAGAATDLEKGRRLFEALSQRLDTEGQGGTRTAREVFAKWNNPKESFSCQEYAKLYVALARDAGLDAFYVHLERDHAGRVVYHDCAALFADGKALLVDPAYHWFGAPHRDFLILDDQQTIAHHFFQGKGKNDAARCRLAAKLHPDFAWGQIQLARALWKEGSKDAARQAIAKAESLQPDRWDTHFWLGALAMEDQNQAEAARHWSRALELNPDSGECRILLAELWMEQGRWEDAQGEFRLALIQDLDQEQQDHIRRRLAELNERLGGDARGGRNDSGRK